MRRCYHSDYPRREETNDAGTVIRVVTLPQVECGAVATLRSSITWPNGSRQHTYTCDAHADKLRKITTDAGFEWDPQPYAPKRK